MKPMNAECTWGDGPDVILTVENKQFDLTAKEAKYLAGRLMMAVEQVEAINAQCKAHDDAMEAEDGGNV